MVRDGGVRQLLRLVKVKYEEEQGRVLCLEVVRTLALLTRGSSTAKVSGAEEGREEGCSLCRLVKAKRVEEQGRVLCLEVVRTLALLTRGSSRARVGAPGACWQETQFNGEWCLIPSR